MKKEAPYTIRYRYEIGDYTGNIDNESKKEKAIDNARARAMRGDMDGGYVYDRLLSKMVWQQT